MHDSILRMLMSILFWLLVTVQDAVHLVTAGASSPTSTLRMLVLAGEKLSIPAIQLVKVLHKLFLIYKRKQSALF